MGMYWYPYGVGDGKEPVAEYKLTGYIWDTIADVFCDDCESLQDRTTSGVLVLNKDEVLRIITDGHRIIRNGFEMKYVHELLQLSHLCAFLYHLRFW